MSTLLEDTPWMVAILCSVLGLLIGSFLNVVIYRLPRPDLRVSGGRSHCPACGAPIAWFDNIPLISWLLLGGRCRSCKGGISPRYPLVELATGALFLGIFHLDLGRHGAAEFPWMLLIVQLIVVAALLAASMIDFDFRILPDIITLPSMVFGVLASALVPALHRDTSSWVTDFRPGSWGFSHGLLAALAGLAGGLAIMGGIRYVAGRALGREAMGLGDVKLMGGLGALTGIEGVLYILLLGALLGSLMGFANVFRQLALRAVRVHRRRSAMRLLRWRVAWKAGREIPFGPALSLAGIIVLLFRSDLVIFLWQTWGDWVRGLLAPG